MANPDLTGRLIMIARMHKAEVSFLHQQDVYSAPPDVLVDGCENNAAGRWFFIYPAEYLATGRYRRRKVADAGRDGYTCWHPEKKGALKDPDGNTVGLFRTFSYVTKIREDGRTSKPARQGWAMIEYTDAHHVGANELVLCVVYRSNHNKCNSASPPEEEPVLVGEGVDPFPFGTFGAGNGHQGGDADDVAGEDAGRVDSPVQISADEIASTEELVTTMGSISSDLFHGLEHPNIASARDNEAPQELGNIVSELQKFAHVTVVQQRSIISLLLTGTAENSKLILSKLSNALLEIGVNFQNLEQSPSEGQVTSITFVVNDSEAKRCVEAIKSAFSAEKSSSAPAASSDSKTKRKVAEEEDHPEAPPAGRRQTNPPTPSSVLQQTNEEVQPGADVEFNSNCPVPVNSSRAISSEPNHPESPQNRTGLATCLGPDDNMELDVNSTWYDKFYTRAHDHPDAPPTGRRQTNPPTPSDEDNDRPGPDLGSSNCPIPEDDEEVQLGADMEFNNCPVQVNSSSTAITHPKMTGTSDLADLFTENEKQRIDGVPADQYRYNAPELPTEVMGFADFATPAYQTFFPTEDIWPIPLGEEEYTYVEVGLWEDEICIQD